MLTLLVEMDKASSPGLRLISEARTSDVRELEMVAAAEASCTTSVFMRESIVPVMEVAPSLSRPVFKPDDRGNQRSSCQTVPPLSAPLEANATVQSDGSAGKQATEHELHVYRRADRAYSPLEVMDDTMSTATACDAGLRVAVSEVIDSKA
jgi:hypothetical protein